MKQIIKNNPLYFGLYIVVWLIGLVWVLSTNKFDQMVLINRYNALWADSFFVMATQLGEGWFFVAIILCYLFISYDKALILTASLGLSSLVSFLLKLSFDNLRPMAFFADKHIKWYFVDGVKINIHLSFPSGHTTTAFAVFTLLTIFLINKKWSVLFLLLACLAGYSRCYLFQHFPEDVLAGSVVGTVSSMVVYILINKMLENNPKDWHRKRLIPPKKS
ncbi:MULTISPECIES: phosphatase PAP2 family protein [unclassified Arcicella]|uniref:phosphatase PAP2 family protein n=1 Tax=unclassified Arcicella TaxID=2644986 RepID=UPI00286343D4|nr:MULTISPECIES: phosphatase PAP2 family protein [unclassified Arcicella]MDR6560417.1 membrane-associated phospholipid phosphatase [Arcicella sp. BE51]MDR6809977.1 membrane-associated phospholipid phosphatase [Arcicella sp. BE140]MDR6821326.1 membrane-associated phospholipid phosphatase [Arcicella sp. BE139]